MSEAKTEAIAKAVEQALAERDRQDFAVFTTVLAVKIVVIAGVAVVAKRAIEYRAIKKDRKRRKER